MNAVVVREHRARNQSTASYLTAPSDCEMEVRHKQFEEDRKYSNSQNLEQTVVKVWYILEIHFG